MASPRNAPTPLDLSVVIPAHNSANVLTSTVTRLAERLAGHPAEIIVVENGSTDATAELCARLSREWSNPTVALITMTSDKGMGNALRAGAMASGGSSVLLTADDLPFGFDDLDGADRIADSGAQRPLVMIGSKAHPDSDVERGALRALMTAGFTALRRAVLRTRTGDPQGTFLVDGTLLRSLAPELTEPGFLFTTELTYAVELAGVRPVELPVRLSAEHRNQPSRVAGADVLNMARGLMGLRERRDLLRKTAGRALTNAAAPS